MLHLLIIPNDVEFTNWWNSETFTTDTHCHWECKIVQFYNKTNISNLQIIFSTLQPLDKHIFVQGDSFFEALFIIVNTSGSVTLLNINLILAGNADQSIYRY